MIRARKSILGIMWLLIERTLEERESCWLREDIILKMIAMPLFQFEISWRGSKEKVMPRIFDDVLIFPCGNVSLKVRVKMSEFDRSFVFVSFI